MDPITGQTFNTAHTEAKRSDPNWTIAKKLETAFLSEMLKATETTGDTGAGSSEFGSFLRHARAEAITAGNGIGLAESLYRALQK